jgi:drug/metabolite transporter (DMT)-like permease
MKNRPLIFDQLVLFSSALAYYFNSVVVAHSTKTTDLTAGFFTFGRAFLGSLVVSVLILFRGGIERPKEPRYMIFRAFAYFFATMTFFETITRLGPALGNLLNLTYPLFLAFFALKTGDDSRTIFGTIVSVIAVFLGITMVLQPVSAELDLTACLIGLSSGLAGAFSIASLRRARSHNSTDVILMFLFWISLPLSLLFFWREIYWPNLRELNLLFWGSLFGLLGQYLITLGSKRLSSTESGVISQSRILIAALCGSLFGLDKPLNFMALVGIGIIFIANIYLVARRV